MCARVLACVLPNSKKYLDGRQCVQFDIESEIALDYHVRTLRKLVYEHIYHVYSFFLFPWSKIGALSWQSAKMKVLYELMLKVPVNSQGNVG